MFNVPDIKSTYGHLFHTFPLWSTPLCCIVNISIVTIVNSQFPSTHKMKRVDRLIVLFFNVAATLWQNTTTALPPTLSHPTLNASQSTSNSILVDQEQDWVSQCHKYEDTLLVTTEGNSYEIECRLDRLGSDFETNPFWVSDFTGCLNECDKQEGCIGVSYKHGLLTSLCYLKDTIVEARKDPTVCGALRRVDGNSGLALTTTLGAVSLTSRVSVSEHSVVSLPSVSPIQNSSLQMAVNGAKLEPRMVAAPTRSGHTRKSLPSTLNTTSASVSPTITSGKESMTPMASVTPTTIVTPGNCNTHGTIVPISLTLTGIFRTSTQVRLAAGNRTITLAVRTDASGTSATPVIVVLTGSYSNDGSVVPTSLNVTNYPPTSGVQYNTTMVTKPGIMSTNSATPSTSPSTLEALDSPIWSWPALIVSTNGIIIPYDSTTTIIRTRTKAKLPAPSTSSTESPTSTGIQYDSTTTTTRTRTKTRLPLLSTRSKSRTRVRTKVPTVLTPFAYSQGSKPIPSCRYPDLNDIFRIWEQYPNKTYLINEVVCKIGGYAPGKNVSSKEVWKAVKALLPADVVDKLKSGKINFSHAEGDCVYYSKFSKVDTIAPILAHSGHYLDIPDRPECRDCFDPHKPYTAKCTHTCKPVIVKLNTFKQLNIVRHWEFTWHAKVGKVEYNCSVIVALTLPAEKNETRIVDKSMYTKSAHSEKPVATLTLIPGPSEKEFVTVIKSTTTTAQVPPRVRTNFETVTIQAPSTTVLVPYTKTVPCWGCKGGKTIVVSHFSIIQEQTEYVKISTTVQGSTEYVKEYSTATEHIEKSSTAWGHTEYVKECSTMQVPTEYVKEWPTTLGPTQYAKEYSTLPGPTSHAIEYSSIPGTKYLVDDCTTIRETTQNGKEYSTTQQPTEHLKEANPGPTEYIKGTIVGATKCAKQCITHTTVPTVAPVAPAKNVGTLPPAIQSEHNEPKPWSEGKPTLIPIPASGETNKCGSNAECFPTSIEPTPNRPSAAPSGEQHTLVPIPAPVSEPITPNGSDNESEISLHSAKPKENKPASSTEGEHTPIPIPVPVPDSSKPSEYVNKSANSSAPVRSSPCRIVENEPALWSVKQPSPLPIPVPAPALSNRTKSVDQVKSPQTLVQPIPSKPGKNEPTCSNGRESIPVPALGKPNGSGSKGGSPLASAQPAQNEPCLTSEGKLVTMLVSTPIPAPDKPEKSEIKGAIPSPSALPCPDDQITTSGGEHVPTPLPVPVAALSKPNKSGDTGENPSASAQSSPDETNKTDGTGLTLVPVPMQVASPAPFPRKSSEFISKITNPPAPAQTTLLEYSKTSESQPGSTTPTSARKPTETDTKGEQPPKLSQLIPSETGKTDEAQPVSAPASTSDQPAG
ncbi:hypothetical protein K469DRAFT_91277 [Zopfia rhizophila CBS 207.26]|uniref:Apple domain-containing protein n=1 Tax=Zopfia rhizophila CBS 207.26 TaxID=1314779 RepID=A0A6A6EBM5_9PEZI|nr:hypothetical protein K469DRAFT_91277 [Zopfia rhizophila CBS 207.26]